MMALEILIGLFVKQIEKVHDYIQIVFTDGTILNIFNAYNYYGSVLFNFSNIEVIGINGFEDYIEIKLSNNGVLKVDLTDEAYRGPEALELIREGESPVVWN